MSAIEPLGAVTAGLGEGPLWDAASGTLLWVDIPGGFVHRTDPADGAETSVHLGEPVSAVLPARDGSLLAAVGHRLIELGTGAVLAEVPHRPDMRFNDGAADPRGRLYLGTMHTAQLPGTACLYRLNRARAFEPVLEGVTISNGLGWSPDGGILYYVDTPSMRVEAIAYDPESGELGARRVFAEFTEEHGRPDGLTVDEDGFVWVALIRGAALHRYAPDGRFDSVIELPVSHPTSCAFGGPGRDELYVTTARDLLTEQQRAEQPLAGRLLRLRPGVRGPVPFPVELDS
ncbi:SMP-30/gluconolactonase/LRE family protein [Sciscionella marina]|uniref:SMP-30/gluconolactonase/LRE family protein n=1 Tax=Sciscionella marina TaxID=508770 RepID=UPI00035F8BA4|nr:SMP-30/gluconolactonase/LRE family protein [Sciscionella marina]